MAFSHPHLRSENDEVSSSARRYNIKTVCHNGQSAALLSSSGLVMYFSTLPAPSSSAPCILTILTHLRVCVKICILTHPHYKGYWQGLCREWALLLNVLYI